MSASLKKCWLKKSKILFCYVLFKVFKTNSLISSFLVSDVSESLISFKSNEQCEQIQNCSFRSPKKEEISEFERFANFLDFFFKP